MVARSGIPTTVASTGNLLYGKIACYAAECVPSPEPLWQSNVRSLTLNGDQSHCPAGKRMLFKRELAQG
jgi:hypothetical protein